MYIYTDKCCSKSILVPCTLFRLIPYAVIRVFTVECILKCVILLCYTGLFCLWFWEMYHHIPLFLTPLLFGTPEYIFILHLTGGINNILRIDNCKPRRETFMFWNLVHLILRDFTVASGNSVKFWKSGKWQFFDMPSPVSPSLNNNTYAEQ